jgi:hypothetical protein
MRALLKQFAGILGAGVAVALRGWISAANA